LIYSNSIFQKQPNIGTVFWATVSGGLPMISDQCILDHVTQISPLTTWHVNALAYHCLLLVPCLCCSLHPSCHSCPSPFKFPFASPWAATNVTTHCLCQRPMPQKCATLINVSQVPCTSSLTLRPLALTWVCTLVDLHIASFGLICSPFHMFLYFSFVLDSLPCLVSLLLNTLTIGYQPLPFLWPCACCCTFDTHLFLLSIWSLDSFSHMMPCSLSQVWLDFDFFHFSLPLHSLFHVVYIVSQ